MPRRELGSFVRRGVVTFGWIAWAAASNAQLASPKPARAPVPAPVPPAHAADPAQAMARELSNLLVMDASRPLDQAALAGYAANARVEKISWEQVFKLAIVRAKAGPNAPLMASFDPAKLDDQAKQLGLDDLATLRAAFLESPLMLNPVQQACELLAALQELQDQYEGITNCQQLLAIYEQLARAESSGIGNLQILQLRASYFTAAESWATTLRSFRDRLDELKVALGLSPHALIVIDDAPLSPFRAAYRNSVAWFRNPGRQVSEVPNLLQPLPALQDIVIEKQSLLEWLGKNADFDRFEDGLQAAARVAESKNEADGVTVRKELQMRSAIRSMIATARDFETARNRYLLAIYQMDAEFEGMVSPPIAGQRRRSTSLLPAQQSRTRTQTRLAALWLDYHATRLRVLQSLGEFPFPSTRTFYDNLTPGPLAPGH